LAERAPPPDLYESGDALSDEATRRITIRSERKIDRAQCRTAGKPSG
jgi:hypothetical protein